MKVLILSVDRDDDFGKKAGLNSPFVGREENVTAVMELGLRDPEDSDVNTVLAALSIYDEMLKKGEDVEIATICGDVKVGYESDLVLTTQLENVLEMVKADRVILVSDGAEDEFIYPIIFSRVKVDSVRRVWVKQAPTVEGTYYIIMKMLADDKMRKRIFPPIGLVLFVLGLFNLIPQFIKLMEHNANLDVISSMAWGAIALVLGIYIVFYAYKVGERVDNAFRNIGTALKNGSQMIPFTITSIILFMAGIFFALDAISKDAEASLLSHALTVSSILLWTWTFSIFTFQAGRFVNMYTLTGKVNKTVLVVSTILFAIAFILQAAFDMGAVIFGYSTFDDYFIFLEIAIGFLLAAFSGLINMNLKGPVAVVEADKEREKENFPEA